LSDIYNETLQSAKKVSEKRPVLHIVGGAKTDRIEF